MIYLHILPLILGLILHIITNTKYTFTYPRHMIIPTLRIPHLCYIIVITTGEQQRWYTHTTRIVTNSQMTTTTLHPVTPMNITTPVTPHHYPIIAILMMGDEQNHHIHTQMTTTPLQLTAHHSTPPPLPILTPPLTITNYLSIMLTRSAHILTTLLRVLKRLQQN